MKTRYALKIIDVFQRTCSCLLDTWKNKFQVPITSLSLHWVFYLQICLDFCRTGQLTSEHAKCTFIIYYYICLPLCAHTLYFDSAKFSIKLFSLIYLTVAVVKQRYEYEIVTETRPIKPTQTALPSKMLNLHKHPDSRAIVRWNQIHIR